MRLPYETEGGYVSEGATFMQLLEHLRLAQEAAATIGHIRKANDDQVVGDGFIKASETLGRICNVVTAMARGVIQ